MRRTYALLFTATAQLALARPALAAPATIQPNASIPGTLALAHLAGGVMTIGLLGAALGFLLSIGGMGLAGHSHNVHLRDRFKSGAGLSLLAAIAFGAANRLLAWAWGIGIGIA